MNRIVPRSTYALLVTLVLDSGRWQVGHDFLRFH